MTTYQPKGRSRPAHRPVLGVLLTGGSGGRLWPVTRGANKHLLPIYDRPVLYYPLALLISAGAREIAVVTSAASQPNMAALLGDGSAWGISIDYHIQASPLGAAHALGQVAAQARGRVLAVALGDNVFLGTGMARRLSRALTELDGCALFAVKRSDPREYGVVDLDAKGYPVRLVEKPSEPTSPWVVTGLYLYDSDAPARAMQLGPSARGEVELTCLNQTYLEQGRAKVYRLGARSEWIDAGTAQGLLSANRRAAAIAARAPDEAAGCPEHEALLQGLISIEQFSRLAEQAPASSYGEMLRSLVEQ